MRAVRSDAVSTTFQSTKKEEPRDRLLNFFFLLWSNAHQFTVDDASREIVSGSDAILKFVQRLSLVEVVGNRKHIVDHSDHFQDSLHSCTSMQSKNNEIQYGDYTRSVSATTRTKRSSSQMS